MLAQPLLLKKCRWMGSYHLGHLEGFVFLSRCLGDLGAPYIASLVAQRLKRLPPLWETRVRSMPGLGRSPGGGHGNPLQYSCLENPMDGGAWWATVHGVAKSRTCLSDFTSLIFEKFRAEALH